MRWVFGMMVVLLATVAAASPFTHQGRLLDGLGTPLQGAGELNVDIFPAQSTGVALWSADFPVVFSDGYYAVEIGVDDTGRTLSTTQLASGLWVQVGVNEVPFGERIAVRSVPTADWADTAANLVGGTVDATEFRLDGQLLIGSSGTFPESTIPDLPASRIASGTLSTDRLDMGDGAGQVARGDHGHLDFPWTQQDMLGQLQAQAICTALNNSSSSTGTYAVRRECGTSTNCNTICAANNDPQDGQLACFDVLHVYGNAPSDVHDVDGLKTRRYSAANCTSAGCGPNYCCCRG